MNSAPGSFEDLNDDDDDNDDGDNDDHIVRNYM